MVRTFINIKISSQYCQNGPVRDVLTAIPDRAILYDATTQQYKC